jgi:hypothetical protein
MIQRQTWLKLRRAARPVAAAATLAAIFCTALAGPADARGGHRGHHHHGMRHARLASDAGPGNETTIKAAAQEGDRLLNTKLKSICRGC